MRIISKVIISMLCIFSAMAVDAATPMSPYSKYGYGLLNDNVSSAQRSMGGVGYAMNEGRQINVMNPASYASMDSLTFLWDVGISLTNLWSKEQGGSAKSTGGGLDYITMQFPISKYIGASIGVLPFSSVGYAFGNEVVHGTASHTGTGGLNQIYAGVSGRPFKGFSVGANVGYLWGHTVNDIYAYTESGSTSLFERVLKIKDYTLNFGAQYSLNLNRKNKVTLGVTFAPGKNFHGETWGVYYDVNNDVAPDTVGFSKLNGDYSMPETWGAGIAYTFDNKLTAEVDFTYQPWKNAKFGAIEEFEQTNFDNRWKVAAGLQYQADSRGSYFKRITYRCGGYFNHDYLNINGNNMREYGVSLGFGLPTPGSKTVINLGFEYKRRSTSPVKLITEDYFNITLGINFNEMWFWQNKIE